MKTRCVSVLAGAMVLVVIFSFVPSRPGFAAEKEMKKEKKAASKEGKVKGERADKNPLSFAKAEVGSLPKGWEVAETAGKGTPAKWEIVADPSAAKGPNVVAITANANSGGTFNLLVAKETSFKDLDLSVMVKAVEGKEDAGGGPIWRARDANSYYIARWNPLETNLRVYFVKDGKRKQIATVEDVKADPKTWHKIEISHVGSKIAAKFDGKKMVAVEDSTFTDAGMVGLWVKADGRTEFSDLSVRPAKAPKAKSEKPAKPEKSVEEKK